MAYSEVYITVKTWGTKAEDGFATREVSCPAQGSDPIKELDKAARKVRKMLRRSYPNQGGES